MRPLTLLDSIFAAGLREGMTVNAAIAHLGATPLAGDAPATTPRAEARPRS